MVRIIRTVREIYNLIYNEVTNSIRTSLVTAEGDSIDVQHPLPTNGDSVYAKDIWVDESTAVNWVDESVSGLPVILVPFTNLHTEICNRTSDPIKTILVHFNRTISLDQVGLGSASGDDFSNLKITILGSGDIERGVLDDSLNDTKYKSRNYQFGPELCNAIRLEFHTTDDVCLTNITIQKVTKVVSRLQAIKDDGVVTDIAATDSGNLKVTDAESGLAIAEGLVIGKSFIHKFGEARNIDTADGFVDIWDGCNDLVVPKITNYTYSLVDDINTLCGTNVNDTQPIEIQGLDINYNLLTQTVTLDGQNDVLLTSGNLLRVFRMVNRGNTDIVGEVFLRTSGSLQTLGVPNDGTTVRAIINDGNNQTLMALYTIPAGKTGFMRDWYASLSRDKLSANSVIHLDARPFGEVFQLKHVSAVSSAGTSYIQHKYEEPEIFLEKTDIVMQASTTVNDSGVSAGFDIVLVDNTTL